MQTGRRQSIVPKTVSLVLPGGNYKEEDVVRFTAAAESAAHDMGADLEVAWEVAVDGGAPVSLSDLAGLLAGAGSDPQVRWVMSRHTDTHTRSMGRPHLPQIHQV